MAEPEKTLHDPEVSELIAENFAKEPALLNVARQSWIPQESLGIHQEFLGIPITSFVVENNQSFQYCCISAPPCLAKVGLNFLHDTTGKLYVFKTKGGKVRIPHKKDVISNQAVYSIIFLLLFASAAS